MPVTCQPRPLPSRLTNQGLPLPIGLCDLVGAAHLAERHAADDEDDDAGPGAVLSRRLVLVPVAVASAGRTQWTGRHRDVTIAQSHSLGPPLSFPTLNQVGYEILHGQQNKRAAVVNCSSCGEKFSKRASRGSQSCHIHLDKGYKVIDVTFIFTYCNWIEEYDVIHCNVCFSNSLTQISIRLALYKKAR